MDSLFLDRWMLAGLRLLGAAAACGVLGGAGRWIGWRGWLVCAAAVAWPVACRPTAVPSSLFVEPAAGVAELMLGVGLGLGAAAAFAALAWAGQLARQAAGLPEGWDDSGLDGEGDPLPRFAAWAGIAAGLQLGLHRTIVDGLLGSFEGCPPGALGTQAAPILPLAGAVGPMLELAVRLALPAVGASVVVQIACGLVARSSPAFRFWGGGAVLVTGSVLLVWGASLESSARLLEQAVERLEWRLDAPPNTE